MRLEAQTQILEASPQTTRMFEDLDKRTLTFASQLEKRLYECKTPEALGEFLVKYDFFNRGFPGGALVLGGKISRATDAFGYEEAEQAGAYLLAGVVDEYMDRSNWKPTTHCSLRRKLTEVSLQSLCPGISTEEVFENPASKKQLKKVMDGTSKGYRLEGDDSAKTLLEGLGFFLGSETSGAFEFSTLHNYLSAKQPQLVKTLQDTEEAGGELYRWVKDHTTLEADHAISARNAVLSALSSQKELSSEEAVKAVAKGVNYFFAFGENVLLTR